MIFSYFSQTQISLNLSFIFPQNEGPDVLSENDLARVEVLARGLKLFRDTFLSFSSKIFRKKIPNSPFTYFLFDSFRISQFRRE